MYAVKYCDATCQRNHWSKHKKDCKRRAAKIHDEALFKDPPAKEDCPICFLPMPLILICCISLQPATISFADANEANEELADSVACTLSISLEILTSARLAKQS